MSRSLATCSKLTLRARASGCAGCTATQMAQRRSSSNVIPASTFGECSNDQRDVQFAIAKSAQHVLRGKIVKLNAHAGICFLKKF